MRAGADAILGLDAALGACSAAVLLGGRVVAEAFRAGERGQAEALAPMAARVLAEAGIAAVALRAVAVTVGPGSFTGLRAALALAQGIAAAGGAEPVGVRVSEALAAPLRLHTRRLWVAIDSRRGRVFLDRGAGAGAAAVDLDALPPPEGPVAVAGDAAIAVAAALAASGADVMLTDVRLPHARHVATVGAARLAGALPPLPAEPLYVDPPEARPPAGGLRAAPV